MNKNCTTCFWGEKGSDCQACFSPKWPGLENWDPAFCDWKPISDEYVEEPILDKHGLSTGSFMVGKHNELHSVAELKHE